jgi:hypothetical protein
LVGPATAADAACFRYDEPVTLSGIVAEALYPEQPNYESVKSGDAPSRRFVLLLREPICTLADDLGDAVPAITALQVNCDAAGYEIIRNNLGEGQTISGVLEPAFNGHHHTPVMLRCETLR